jgi:DNA (cytosine-5)-methyltransferase 1
MTHGSLFSGIGGFDLAAEWMGWKNSFHCEWNEFGQQILKHYWPEAKSYHLPTI